MNIDELEKLRKTARNNILIGILISAAVTSFLITKTYGLFFTVYPLIFFPCKSC